MGSCRYKVEDQAWYYRHLLDDYTSHPPSIADKALYRQFKEAVAQLFGATM